MDFLAGVKRLRQECGVPGVGPITVVDQTGEMRRLVDWYAQALIEIQLEEIYWNFLRKSLSFDTVAEQNTYEVDTDVGLSDFATYRDGSFRIYLKSGTRGDEIFLTQYNYDNFRDIYLYGTQLTSYSRPTTIAHTPDDSLVLGLPPDDVYTVIGEYYRTPVEVTLDDDVPVLPARFHMLIVYSAMMSYGMFEAAGEVYQRGEINYKRLMNRMRMAEGPNISTGASLI